MDSINSSRLGFADAKIIQAALEDAEQSRDELVRKLAHLRRVLSGLVADGIKRDLA